ncbi:ATP-dependent translocase ABCB1-like isoform X1 [Ostrea edulis]|uniref:ATP-dependent translocase ABCB1-like isoform X1 n=1 Tax=Ostrea edulis TaxID=37623 RepID=UPI0024AF84CE|nr:ATP-dependent translocase ABCB1-like isoform X1 [Ostrea edulis]
MDLKKLSPESPKAATFGQLFRYAGAFDRFLILIGSIFAIVVGGGWPVLSIIFGELTDTFVSGPGGMELICINGSIAVNVTGNTTGNSSSADDFNDKMSTYAFYYLYLSAIVLVAGYFQIMCWTTACERQVHTIRKSFFRSIIRQEIGWFDKHQSGELTTRLADDIGKIKDGLGDKFSFTLQYTAQFLSGFAIGFWKSWKMTLVMMSITPILAVSAGVFSVFIRNYTKREQESYAGAGSVAEEVLSCIRTVISFNGQRQEQIRYEKELTESKRIGIRKTVVQGSMIGSIMFFMFSTYALAFWYGSEQAKDWYTTFCATEKEGISPGEVLTVFFCVMIGSFSLGNAAPHLGSIFAAKGAAAVVFETIDNVPTIDGTSDKGQVPVSLSGDIDFVGVEFTYPTREEVKVLKNFNLSIGCGQTVALVGASGCGKSTVVNLIQRMYDPQNGRVLLDGNDLKDLNTNWLRNNIGVVSQEPILFGMTIAENIKLGNPDVTIQEVEEAAKAANAHDFIQQLPNDYQTLVGERGAQLSGGQKQRVAIARALVRNPRILLLDEATSALDSESEKIVQSALDKARLGRTTVVVAHRLTTIQNADVIYVMDKGEIIESGTHSKLMEKEEFYYQLVQAQSLVYEDDQSVNGEFGAEKPAYKRQRSRVSTSSEKGDHLVKTQPSVNKETKEEKVEEVEEEEVDKPKFLRILRENFPECPFLIFGTLFSAIQGSTMPLFALFFGEMIKVFIDINSSDNVLWSMMFLALGGLNFICHLFMNVNLGIAGERMTFRLRLKTFKAYLRQDATYFDDPKHGTGALTTRLATDASLIRTATGFRIGTILSSIVSLVAALVIAFYYGWKLALVVLGGVPILMLSSSLQIKVVMGKHKDDQSKLEDAGKIASETIENIRTVQSLTREKYFYKLYSDHLESPLRSNLKQAQIYGFAYGFSQCVVFAMYGGAFRFGAWQVSLGEMAPENVYKVFFAIAFTGMTIGQASSFLPDYSKAQHSAGLIFKVLDTIPGIDVYSPRGTYLNNVEGRIVFKNVSFCYPMRSEVRVLKSLSLTVEPGQTVALVGPSGCGKSTTISLLQRFYDVKDGEINVDGVDIRNLNLSRLRSFISVVSQEPVLFDCSIRENISYGVDFDVGMDDIIEAARKANIHEFITQLPAGYETVVGEKGTQLSGGQKQRVAIARAIVRNPRILLLDEATSALDTESEKQVQEALDTAQEGRTCIVIAHRLSTIQNCDVIYVIDDGQVVESGSHQALLSLKGVYSSLVSAQQFTK